MLGQKEGFPQLKPTIDYKMEKQPYQIEFLMLNLFRFISLHRQKIVHQMNLEELLRDTSKKPKEKTETMSQWLLDNSLSMDDLIGFASRQKDTAKATCIEAIEFASKKKPDLVDDVGFQFVTENLAAKAPRIKWESAKVIGNVAHLFPDHLERPIQNLLANARHEGTVVRWSAAFALGEILKLGTKHNASLLPELEAICGKEIKNSIQKIYLVAITKTKKGR